jgi:phage terminase small subunit
MFAEASGARPEWTGSLFLGEGDGERFGGDVAKRLTQKQEIFCVTYFKTGNATRAALAAGYSRRRPEQAGWDNLNNPMVAARIEELRKRTEDETVARVLERKRRLSEIARGRITDYVNADGTGFVVDKDSVNPGAVEQMSMRVRRGRNGGGAEVTVAVKLHDPVRAIDMLNKMEGLYSERDSASGQVTSFIEEVMVRPESLRLEGPTAGTE